MLAAGCQSLQSSCEHAETALRVKSLVESLQVIRTVAVGLGTYLHRHACCVDLCQWWLWCCLLGGGWVAPSCSSEHDGLLPGVQIASGKLHQALAAYRIAPAVDWQKPVQWWYRQDEDSDPDSWRVLVWEGVCVECVSWGRTNEKVAVGDGSVA
jgi:hypothetical protein